MSKKSRHAARDKHAATPAPRVSSGELRRKLVHISVGGFALLLRFLTPFQAVLMAIAAFIFNWQVLPRIGGKQLWRGGE